MHSVIILWQWCISTLTIATTYIYNFSNLISDSWILMPLMTTLFSYCWGSWTWIQIGDKSIGVIWLRPCLYQILLGTSSLFMTHQFEYTFFSEKKKYWRHFYFNVVAITISPRDSFYICMYNNALNLLYIYICPTSEITAY